MVIVYVAHYVLFGLRTQRAAVASRRAIDLAKILNYVRLYQWFQIRRIRMFFGPPGSGSIIYCLNGFGYFPYKQK